MEVLGKLAEAEQLSFDFFCSFVGGGDTAVVPLSYTVRFSSDFPQSVAIGGVKLPCCLCVDDSLLTAVPLILYKTSVRLSVSSAKFSEGGDG